MLSYAGCPDPKDEFPIGLGHILTIEPTAEVIDKVFKNLIVIVDHFFNYGLIKPKMLSKDDDKEKITHYWQLITKYYSALDTVSFVNETMADKPDTNKALSWIIVVLNEPPVLQDVFK